MGFWYPSLNKLNKILANLYDREESQRIVESSGLDLGHIAFSDKAIDNWYAILREANQRHKLKDLIEFAIEDSGSRDLQKTYEEYLATSTVLGGDAPFLPPFVRKLGQRLKPHLGLIVTLLGGSLIVAVIGLGYYFFFSTTSISGVISCDNSTPLAGQRKSGVTVIVNDLPNLNGVTDDKGAFIIDKIPRYKTISQLNARYAGDSHLFDPKRFPDNDFRVIPCPYERPAKQHEIPQAWWKETKVNTAGVNIACKVKEGVTQVKLFTLNPDAPIRKTEPGENLFLVINLPAEGEIVKGNVAFPVNGPSEILPSVPTNKERQWKIPMPGNDLELKVRICVGTTPPPEVSPSLLSGYYYFGNYPLTEQSRDN